MNDIKEDLSNVSRIIFSKRNYSTVTEMYLKIAQQLQLLMETGNICIISDVDDGKGTIMIEFNPDNPAVGLPYPYWLYPEEVNSISISKTKTDA